jgi:hypothetical protein
VRSSRSLPGHADDDLSSSVSLFEIPDGLGNLGERVGPVDDRCDLPGFDELGEDDQVLVVLRGHERAQLLAHEREQQVRPEQAADYPQPSSAAFASDDDERPLRREGAPQTRQRRVPTDVEDQVVQLIALGEVLAGVVEDLLGSDRTMSTFVVPHTPVT